MVSRGSAMKYGKTGLNEKQIRAKKLKVMQEGIRSWKIYGRPYESLYKWLCKLVEVAFVRARSHSGRVLGLYETPRDPSPGSCQESRTIPELAQNASGLAQTPPGRARIAIHIPSGIDVYIASLLILLP